MFRFETWVTYIYIAMFRMFRKPVSVLDEKSNKTIMWFRIMFQIHLKEMRHHLGKENEKDSITSIIADSNWNNSGDLWL